MEKRSLKGVLSGRLFDGLKAGYLELLAGCAKNERFSSGERLFSAGEAADRFYLIRRGRVAIDLPVCRAKFVTIQTVEPGEILGWSWLIPPYRWHLGARAYESVLALSFDAKCLRRKFDKDPAMGYEFYKRFCVVMSRRLESTFLQMLGVCG